MNKDFNIKKLPIFNVPVKVNRKTGKLVYTNKFKLFTFKIKIFVYKIIDVCYKEPMDKDLVKKIISLTLWSIAIVLIYNVAYVVGFVIMLAMI